MNPINLKVASIPLDIVWCNPEANLRKVEETVETLPDDTDIIVLPELFSTGFISDPEVIVEFSETTGGETLTRLRKLAKKKNAAVSGSMLVRDHSHCYNRAFFIEPSGDEMFYDKRHLFSVSPESKVLTPGKERCPIIRFRGWNISMVICYDIRFPVWCRNVGFLYEVLLVPANWPLARDYAWKHLLIGRSIENQAYIVGCNRSGDDDYGTYDNLSYIFDPMGKAVHQTDVSTGVLTASLDHEYLESVRRRLPVGNDAENFCISDL